MIARKSALIIATNIIGGVLGYIALFFITKYMTPEEFGIVSFALGFVTLFSIIGDLGFHLSHVKKVSEGKDIDEYTGTFIVIKIILTAAMVSILVGSFFFWKTVMNRGFESYTHETAIFIMIIVWVFRLLGQIFTTTFRAKREIAKTQIPLFLNNLIRVLVTIYVAIGGYGAIALAIAYVFGEIAFFLSSIYLFRGYPVKKPSKEKILEYSYFAFPLIIVVASTTIITSIDKVIIQFFWASESVGYYEASFKFSYFINMFAVAIGTLLLPTYSNLHAKNNIKAIKRLTYESERYLSMLVFPMVFGVIVIAEPIGTILLSGWTATIPIMQILPLYVLFLALENPYSSHFIGMNRPKLARNRVVIMVITNVILNMILIPAYIQTPGIKMAGLGAKGAAIATVTSYFIGLVYSRIYAYKLNKIKGCNRIFIHLFAAVIMAAVLYFLLYNLEFINYLASILHLIAFCMIGVVIYLGILVLFKEFTKKDYHLFVDTIHLGKMVRYITDEIKHKK